jgi:hypothetical protein
MAILKLLEAQQRFKYPEACTVKKTKKSSFLHGITETKKIECESRWEHTTTEEKFLLTAFARSRLRKGYMPSVYCRKPIKECN